MAQRISRAKATITAPARVRRAAGGASCAERLRAVLHVLYLVFNEGYAAIVRARPAARRARRRGDPADAASCAGCVPDDGEVGRPARADAADRRPARRRARRPTAALVPLAEQDRVAVGPRRDRRGRRARQRALAERPARAVPAAGGDRRGARRGARRRGDRLAADPRALRAAGARCSEPDGRRSTARSRWPWSTARGAGLACSTRSTAIERMDGHHRLDAVRAHLLELAGEVDGARDAYRRAARRTTSLPEQRYLEGRAARLG